MVKTQAQYGSNLWKPYYNYKYYRLINIHKVRNRVAKHVANRRDDIHKKLAAREHTMNCTLYLLERNMHTPEKYGTNIYQDELYRIHWIESKPAQNKKSVLSPQQGPK